MPRTCQPNAAGSTGWPTPATRARDTRSASMPPRDRSTSAWLEKAEAAFHDAHFEEYGHRFKNGTVEVINIRVEASAVMDDLPTPDATKSGSLDDALVETRPVTFEQDGKPVTLDTGFYDRDRMGVGTTFAGPAIIEQYDSTVVIPPGFSGTVDAAGNLVIDCPAATQTRRETGHPDPDARDRRRPELRGQGNGLGAVPHGLLLDHPRVRGPRCRPVRQGRQRAGRVRLHADVHGLHAQDRQGRDLGPRRRHPRG